MTGEGTQFSHCFNNIISVGTCPDPTPDNGYIGSMGSSPVDGRFKQGTSVRFECNTGYAMDFAASGLNVITCNSGRWYPPPVKCVPIDEGEKIENKYFESNTVIVVLLQ